MRFHDAVMSEWQRAKPNSSPGSSRRREQHHDDDEMASSQSHLWPEDEIVLYEEGNPRHDDINGIPSPAVRRRGCCPAGRARAARRPRRRRPARSRRTPARRLSGSPTKHRRIPAAAETPRRPRPRDARKKVAVASRVRLPQPSDAAAIARARDRASTTPLSLNRLPTLRPRRHVVAVRAHLWLAVRVGGCQLDEGRARDKALHRVVEARAHLRRAGGAAAGCS